VLISSGKINWLGWAIEAGGEQVAGKVIALLVSEIDGDLPIEVYTQCV